MSSNLFYQKETGRTNGDIEEAKREATVGNQNAEVLTNVEKYDNVLILRIKM